MLNVFNELIEEKLLHLNTAGLATIVSTNGNTASIKPLALVKSVGGIPQEQAVLEDVPILEHVKYIAGLSGQTPLKAGQIVMYVCCDREISQSKLGKMTLPALGHHELGAAIIVGRLM